jgi:hypothetical protein
MDFCSLAGQAIGSIPLFLDPIVVRRRRLVSTELRELLSYLLPALLTPLYFTRFRASLTAALSYCCLASALLNRLGSFILHFPASFLFIHRPGFPPTAASPRSANSLRTRPRSNERTAELHPACHHAGLKQPPSNPSACGLGRPHCGSSRPLILILRLFLTGAQLAGRPGSPLKRSRPLPVPGLVPPARRIPLPVGICDREAGALGITQRARAGGIGLRTPLAMGFGPI